MDNVHKLGAVLLLLPSLTFASQGVYWANQYTTTWVDGPAPATFVRDTTGMTTYVDMPDKGGHAAYTLESQSPKQGIGSSVGAASTATTPKIATNVKIPLAAAAGTTLAATLTGVIPKAALAKTGMALVRANPYVSTAVTLGWLANAGYALYKDSQGNEQIGSVPPNTTSTLSVYSSSGCSNQSSMTDSMTCTMNVTRTNHGCATGTVSAACPNGYHLNSQTSTSFNFDLTYNGATSNYTGMGGAIASTTNCASGYTLVGGVCTLNYTPTPTPVDDTTIQNGLTAAPVSGTSDSAVAFDNLIAEHVANGFTPPLDGNPPVLSGSSSPIQGPHSQTTTPDGNVTTNNTTYAPTFNNDNSVRISQTDVTTVLHPDNTTSTTTTTSAPVPPVPSSSNTNNQQVDCDKYPNSIGCSQYGTTPTADVVPLTTVSIALSPTSLGSGSCPAPNVKTVHGQSVTFTYQPYCDFSTAIAPLLLALAWVAAGLIVLSPIRG